MSNSFKERARNCRTSLTNADGIVLAPGPNQYYLSGFFDEPGERHLLLFLAQDGNPVFIIPEMYANQIRKTSWIENIRTWEDGDDPTELIADVLDALGIRGGHILLDDRMWTKFTQDIHNTLPDASFGLASEVLTELRIIKDEHEIDALRRAGEISDQVSSEIRRLGEDVIGWTERELAANIKSRLRDRGGEGVGFEVIVGSGPNGAKPHHRKSDREIGVNDPVVLDFGTTINQYPGDQTRTMVFGGDPSAEFRDAFKAVSAALEDGINRVEPGLEAQEVDRTVRKTIQAHDFGEEFIHRTGHGIGLEVHEPPYIVEGNNRVIEPGMVFSIEPGVYLDGKFGVRLEDIVVVTADGCKRLNHSSQDWRV